MHTSVRYTLSSSSSSGTYNNNNKSVGTSSSYFQVRVYGRPEYMQDLAMAHDIAAVMQDWYENWTGIVNPTEKVGQYKHVFTCF